MSRLTLITNPLKILRFKMSSGKIWQMRKDYDPVFPFIDLGKNTNPFQIFNDWFEVAKKNDDSWEPNSMVISTVNQDGIPSSRFVLLKQFTEDGFQFFTNYNSQKAKDIEKNNNVSLLFYWYKQNRQVRIQGTATKISHHESIDYFKTRPLKSQISATISEQSSPISEKEFGNLKEKSDFLFEQINSGISDIECPLNWGGYLVKPFTYEFWQGNHNRFHDRCQFVLTENKSWDAVRLQP